MKKSYIAGLFFLLGGNLLLAQPGAPEWIEGRWRSENGNIWSFERINSGNEGIITAQDEAGNVVEVWGW